MKKNIVIFIQNISRRGGSERASCMLADYLSSYFNVTILSICGSNVPGYPLRSGVKVRTLIHKDDINNKREIFNVLNKLSKYYHNHHTDIVIDIFESLSIYTLILKSFYHYKNISWSHMNILNDNGMNKLGRWLSTNFSDALVVLTESDRIRYLEKYPNVSNRIQAISNASPYYGVEVNLQSKEKIVLAVGRLNSQKRFDRLLKVWSIFEQYNNDWNLKILGDGEERCYLEKLIKDLEIKRAELVGSVSNIDDYYRRASVLLSTSDYEGLPMCMIEALSFAIPIISFDYYSGPADIIENDYNGYIVLNSSKDNQEREMASYLAYLTKNHDEMNRMMHNSYDKSFIYQPESVFKQWIDLIERLD